MSRHQLSYVYQTHFCMEKSRVFNHRFQELDKLHVCLLLIVSTVVFIKSITCICESAIQKEHKMPLQSFQNVVLQDSAKANIFGEYLRAMPILGPYIAALTNIATTFFMVCFTNENHNQMIEQITDGKMKMMSHLSSVMT